MKKNKSLLSFVICSILVALILVLPENIKAELGPIITLVTFVLIIIGIFSLNRFVVSKMSPRMFFVSGFLIIFIGVIGFIYSLKAERISWSLFGFHLLLDNYLLSLAGIILLVSCLIAGTAMLIHSGGEVVEQSAKRIFKLLIAGPVIATVIALIFHFGLGFGGNSSSLADSYPGLNGKLWEWLVYGLKSGLNSLVGIVIFVFIVYLVNYFLGEEIARFKLRLEYYLAPVIGILLFGIFFGISFWLRYRFDIATDDWLTPIAMLTIIIWGYGFLNPSSNEI